MTIEKRLAVTFPLPSGLEHSFKMSQWAMDNGFKDIWFSDAGGLDSLTMAAGVLQQFPTARVGIAVVPVFTRTPAVLAATATALAVSAPGRFVLGLGSSSHAMMEGWHGQKFEKPLTRVKETTQLVKQMLQGEKTNFSGTTVSSKGYRGVPLGDKAPPVYLGALREKMLEMAAAEGDGVVVNLFPHSAWPKMREAIFKGAKQAGKDPESVEVVIRHQVLVTDDKAAARNAVRAAFAPYYATPVYNKFLAWCGYADAAEAISQGFKSGDRAATAAAMSDDLIDEIAIIGSAEECRAKLKALADQGVHTHILATVSPRPEDVQRTYEAFAADKFSF